MTDKEKELIYLLAQRLTGAHPEGTYQIGIFITNIGRRMHETGHTNVQEYLAFAKENQEEHSHLLSALSIHTTSWFRENPHYVILQKVLLARDNRVPFRTWSCACSTGEEVYSLALLFEEFRHFHTEFNYNILGTDIDPISLESAKRAIYHKRHLAGPVSYYKKHVRLGSGSTEDYFTFSPEVRGRVQFKPLDIRRSNQHPAPYDLIMCRNVLIYFQAKQVEEVIGYILQQLVPGGHLILGHSELIDHVKFGLTFKGHSVYEKTPPQITKSKNLPRKPAKVIRPCPPLFHPRVIVIGASTGGPDALAKVLRQMPTNSPPIVVALHISGDFSRGFGERLAAASGLQLGSFADGTKLRRGHLYCADAEHHLAIMRDGENLILKQQQMPPINGLRPNIDHLFQSAYPISGETIAILLSGMGRDGADGIRGIHNQAGYTYAQAEEDCVVFGMPKEAIALGAADFIGTTEQIRESLIEIIQRQPTSGN